MSLTGDQSYVLCKDYTDSSILGTTGPLHGKSAFEIAQLNGFTGTEAEWVIDQAGHPPFIIKGSTVPNTPLNHWATWDSAARAYTDSGVPANLSFQYTHVQAVPSDTWQVQHNLGGGPVSALCLDQSDEEIVGAIDYAASTLNLLVIKFSEPLSGKAYIKL